MESKNLRSGACPILEMDSITNMAHATGDGYTRSQRIALAVLAQEDLVEQKNIMPPVSKPQHNNRNMIPRDSKSKQLESPPCDRIAQLKLNPTNSSKKASKKSHKLLSSKSLTQLIKAKSFIFARSKSSQLNATKNNSQFHEGSIQQQQVDNHLSRGSQQSERSATNSDRSSKGLSVFANGSYQSHDNSMLDNSIQNQQTQNFPFDIDSILDVSVCANSSNSNRQIDSESLIAFPRQSTSRSLHINDGQRLSDGTATSSTSSITSHLSPIVSPRSIMMRNVVASTPALEMRRLNAFKVARGGGHKQETGSSKDLDHQLEQAPKLAQDLGDGGGENDANSVIKTTGTKIDEQAIDQEKRQESGKMRSYKPFKNTALVLRDVKNSIGLRLRAKQDSQAFQKLTNELTTSPAPPTTRSTKLYSPFNIYTPKCSSSDVNDEKSTDLCKQNKPVTTTNKKLKSKKKLNLVGQATELADRQHRNENGKSKQQYCPMTDSGYCSMIDQKQQQLNTQQDIRSPKVRIAARHKKHLMQANKFTFDSPTGRLRESVRDVEQMQRCIEDISKAIEARGPAS